MLIAKEGRKNLEAKANYIDPRGVNNPASVSMLSGLRKPQIRF